MFALRATLSAALIATWFGQYALGDDHTESTILGLSITILGLSVTTLGLSVTTLGLSITTTCRDLPHPPNQARRAVVRRPPPPA